MYRDIKHQKEKQMLIRLRQTTKTQFIVITSPTSARCLLCKIIWQLLWWRNWWHWVVLPVQKKISLAKLSRNERNLFFVELGQVDRVRGCGVGDTNVHLSYCSPIKVQRIGDIIVCPCCQQRSVGITTARGCLFWCSTLFSYCWLLLLQFNFNFL